MTETTAELYDRSSDRWERTAPVLLSDFTARPFLLNWSLPLESQRVLDLGTGEGYVARQLMERGAASVHGIDVSAEMIARARSQKEGQEQALSYAVGDATCLAEQEDASFDLVMAVFLFNYLDREQTQACMSEVARVLRPGGRFIFAVPHPSLPFVREEQPPFYFARGDQGYFSGRDALFEGRIWRRGGEGVRVRCVHKTLDDYFQALAGAGFRHMPELRELHATDEHLAFDPEFFEPLRDQPLHLAFRLER